MGATGTTDEAIAQHNGDEVVVFQMAMQMPGMGDAEMQEVMHLTLTIGRSEPVDARGYFLDVVRGGTSTGRVWHLVEEGDTDETAALEGVELSGEMLSDMHRLITTAYSLRSMLQAVPVSQMEQTTAVMQQMMRGVLHAGDN